MRSYVFAERFNNCGADGAVVPIAVDGHPRDFSSGRCSLLPHRDADALRLYGFGACGEACS